MIKNNLKQIRDECNMTRRQFAQKLDMSEMQFGRYENGSTQPSLETALKIVSILSSKRVEDIWYISET